MNMEALAEKEQWRLLRKSRSDLIVAGRAVLAFGVYAMFKVMLVLLAGEEYNIESLIDPSLELSKEAQAGLLIAFAGFFTLICLLFHYIIYRGAVKEGHGKKAGRFYLAATVIYIAVNLLSVVVTILYRGAVEDPLSFVSSILFDLALVISGIDVLYNAVKSRRLLRALEGGNHER